MIDPSLRLEHLDRRPPTRHGVILLDVVLGHGAHPDPRRLLAARRGRGSAGRSWPSWSAPTPTRRASTGRCEPSPTPAPRSTCPTRGPPAEPWSCCRERLSTRRERRTPTCSPTRSTHRPSRSPRSTGGRRWRAPRPTSPPVAADPRRPEATPGRSRRCSRSPRPWSTSSRRRRPSDCSRDSSCTPARRSSGRARPGRSAAP